MFVFLLIFLSLLLANGDCTYTHAAFVNDLRQSQMKERTSFRYDSSEEYSLQMNQTALLGLPKCRDEQCQRIAIVGAGQ